MTTISFTSCYNKKFTAREREVLVLMSYGYSSEEMARKLYISTHTIISHRKNLMDKLNARNTAEMIRRGFELELLHTGVIREVAC